MYFQLIPSPIFFPQRYHGHPVPYDIRFSAVADNGISIVALKNMSTELQAAILDGTEPAIGNLDRSNINFRVIWPGYHHNTYGRKIINVSSLTRSELASEVAKHVVFFISYVKKQGVLCAINDSPFAIMERGIKMTDIRLVGITHTADNCWQPVLHMAIAPEADEI